MDLDLLAVDAFDSGWENKCLVQSWWDSYQLSGVLGLSCEDHSQYIYIQCFRTETYSTQVFDMKQCLVLHKGAKRSHGGWDRRRDYSK